MPRPQAKIQTPLPTKPRTEPAPDVRTRVSAAQGPSLAGLEQLVGYVIRRAQVAIFEDFNERMAEFGITTTTFTVLRLTRDNPGLNQRSLATALGAETSRMVLIIDELERRGILSRLASTLDRRARAIYLTAEGRKLLKTLEKRVAVHERMFAKRLRGGDKKELLRMLRNLATPV